MKILTMGWMSVFFSIAIINIYIWNCYWKIPFRTNKVIKTSVYLVIHILLTFISVYYFYLFFNGKTGTKISRTLSYITGFYLVFLNFSMFFYLTHDLIYATRNFIPYPKGLRIFVHNLFFGGFVIFAIAAVIALLGIFNSKKVIVKEYDIVTSRKESSMEKLNAVFLSDAHIGTSVTKNNIDEIITKINNLNPDIVFLGGDFFDEGTTEEDKIISCKKLSESKTKYGIIYIEGNHEYKVVENAEDINNETKHFSDVGIIVLQDEAIKINNQFYVIGRKDKYVKRMPLKDLTSETKENLPIIVLDHRPKHDEAVKLSNINIQLSGHTHNGQIFPFDVFDFIVSKITKSYSYGHKKLENLDLVVSSGVGDWGIPVRVGSRREIVSLKITFED